MVSPAARKNLEAHIQGERERNIEALMGPLSDYPHCVIPDYLLDGRAAVKAMYRLSPELSDEYLRALDAPAVTRWGEDHCVIEYSDEYPLLRGMVVVVHFDGDRVKSENTYFTSGTRFASAVLPADAFSGVPGAANIS